MTDAAEGMSVPREPFDRRLAVVVWLSFVVHFGFVGWLHQLDWPREVEPTVRLVVPRPLPLPREKPTPATSVIKSAPAAVKTGGGAKRGATNRRTGLLQILGAPGGGGLLDGLIQPSDPDRVFAEVGGVSLSQAGPRLREAGAATRRDGRAISLAGPAAVQIGDRGGERLAQVQVGVIEPTEPTVDASQFAAELRQYLSGIRACYERRLRDEVALGGKLTLQLTIAQGRVSEVAVDEDTLHDGELEACIRAHARSWRFSVIERSFVLRVPLIFQAAR
jgi:hypothetical protein